MAESAVSSNPGKMQDENNLSFVEGTYEVSNLDDDIQKLDSARNDSFGISAVHGENGKRIVQLTIPEIVKGFPLFENSNGLLKITFGILEKIHKHYSDLNTLEFELDLKKIKIHIVEVEKVKYINVTFFSSVDSPQSAVLSIRFSQKIK